MNIGDSRRAFAALGLCVALTMAVGAASFGAQTEPRDLPANPPQTEATAQNGAQAPQQDRLLDRRDGAQAGRLGDRLDRRLDFLHQRLRISAAQERVWDDFASAVRGEAQTVRDRFEDRRDRVRDGRRGRPTVVERLERRQQTLANRSARVDHLLSALRPLYAALNANQKQTADRLFFRPEAERGRFFNRRVPGSDGRFDRFGRSDRRFDRNYF